MRKELDEKEKNRKSVRKDKQMGELFSMFGLNNKYSRVSEKMSDKEKSRYYFSLSKKHTDNPSIRLKYLKKALEYNPNRFIIRVEMFDAKYKRKAQDVDEFIIELKKEFNKIVEKNNLEEKDYCKLYKLEDSFDFIFGMYALYNYFFRNKEYVRAIHVGEKLLELNRIDSFGVKFSLPLIYINANDIDGCKKMLNRHNSSSIYNKMSRLICGIVEGNKIDTLIKNVYKANHYILYSLNTRIDKLGRRLLPICNPHSFEETCDVIGKLNKFLDENIKEKLLEAIEDKEIYYLPFTDCSIEELNFIELLSYAHYSKGAFIRTGDLIYDALNYVKNNYLEEYISLKGDSYSKDKYNEVCHNLINKGYMSEEEDLISISLFSILYKRHNKKEESIEEQKYN